MNAVRLVASVPSVKAIVVNLLGVLHRCDEVAKGIVGPGNAAHNCQACRTTRRVLLAEKGTRCRILEQVVKAALEMTR